MIITGLMSRTNWVWQEARGEMIVFKDVEDSSYERMKERRKERTLAI